MLFATRTTKNLYSEISGHVGQENLAIVLKEFYASVTEIQADGDELVKCCEILGRQLPKGPVYTFLDINAQEIARNWATF
jgi:hypothetical protein